ncbi:nucleobase-ascorbate transporter [Musa troglodytarum]|uniref:Nucleobase-ascorbate transporter n=1 Tax=Musa troglodytarum TaxID=320322 RepID=A0A9E7H2P3_9LILI|nr:nucleobase-ascorbate transporter [Musa troglodytarum]
MENISHPPMEQLQDLEYCIDSNPPWVAIVLMNRLGDATALLLLCILLLACPETLILSAHVARQSLGEATKKEREEVFQSARFKFPYPLQWGAPTFDAGHSVAMMAAVLVSIIESTGAYKAASRLAIATPPPAYVLSRGIGWQFNGFLNTIFLSPPTVGLIVSVFLDNTLEVEKSKKDRGMPWWVKFRTFRGDNRNEEFYTLPFNLNRFFPPT